MMKLSGYHTGHRHIAAVICAIFSMLLFVRTVLAEETPEPEVVPALSSFTPTLSEFTLVENGAAKCQIIVARGAEDTSKKAAEELAEYLERISGAKFEIAEGNGETGLAVGGIHEFPNIKSPDVFAPDDPLRSEDFVITTHTHGMLLLGATAAGSRLAVWDLLRQLGYRQYFPTPTWEIVPSMSDIKLSMKRYRSPSYAHRKIWYGGGMHGQWQTSRQPFRDWQVKNLCPDGSGFDLISGHAYGSIIRANKASFDNDPMLYAEIDGVRKSQGGNSKFCISNPALRKLVVDYAVRVFENNPDQTSISMDPSDGGNWCECKGCSALGSISNQVVLLANDVAEAINELGLGDKYVGLKSYASYCEPPTIKVHPKVIVLVSTAFLREGYSANQLVELWAKQGAIIGLREFYAISIWDKDLPGKASAANLGRLVTTIPAFYDKGARFNSANIGESWGAYGLGFYIIAHCLFDVNNAQDLPGLLDDFFSNAFGPARPAMEAYYRLINRWGGSERAPFLSEHLVGSMYRELHKAMLLAADHPMVLKRIQDLVLYTRYVELYAKALRAGGKERQALCEEILRHFYAIRRTMMVNGCVMTKGAKRRLPEFDVPNAENLKRLRDRDSYSEEEILAMVETGVEENALMGFEPVQFSEELIPAFSSLQLPEVKPGSFGGYAPRGRRAFYTWLHEPGAISLRVTGGLISKYRNRGNVRISLESPLDELVEGVAHDDSVPPDGQEHIVRLDTPYDGLHKVIANDGGDATEILLVDDQLPFTIPSGPEESYGCRGRWSLYFYVPKGTKIVGGYTSTATGTIADSKGRVVYDFSAAPAPGYFSVPVEEAESGRLWKMQNILGTRHLMTVPPYYASDSKSLLLPREVVEQDRPLSN